MTTSASLAESARAHRGLNTALWVAQVLLAAAFVMAGSMKMMTPSADLAQQMPDLPVALIRFIGIAEIAGAIGLILPAATRIGPALTPLAAIGLAVIMLLAGAFHLSRGELSSLPVVFALGGLALFVAWGRSRKVPILARR
jgi:uncharacterized membrane protein YphA (DoxX/SURF4 family)